MSEREWRKRHNNGYEEYYDNMTYDSYRMIHEHIDEARCIENKISRIQDFVAQMFSALTLEQRIEIMEAVEPSWELVDE